MAAKLRSRAGLTMIEVLVASVILTALVAMSSWLIWGSSKHVSRMETEMALENQAREFITLLTKELKQANMANIKWVDDAQVIDFKSTTDTPGSLQATTPLAGTGRPLFPPNAVGVPPIWTPANPGYYFNAIRFKLPSLNMELTGNNANPNANGTIDPITKKQVDNFDLAKFKANGDRPDYLYEIQYWWEIDNTVIANEGVVGTGPNGFVGNGVDDNGNGVIDEGVVKKCEVWKNSDGTIRERRISTVLRDVTGLKFTIPGVRWSGYDANGNPLWNGAPVTAGAERIVTVSFTLQKADPTVSPSKVINPTTGVLNHIIYKSYTAMIEVRNN